MTNRFTREFTVRTRKTKETPQVVGAAGWNAWRQTDEQVHAGIHRAQND